MGHSTLKILAASAVLLQTACLHQPTGQIDGARVDQSALYFYADPLENADFVTQVEALSATADDLVHRSKVRGATIGAAVGCGLAVVSATQARRCVAGAAVGGLGGAFIGEQAGQRDLARRVELVSADHVGRDLQSATSRFARIKADLPTLLAEQEAELNALTMQHMRGEISQDEYNGGVARIEGERIAIAEALEMSARDARIASRNLSDAAARGQTGLDWHIGAAERLAEDVQSTRGSFELF